MNGANLPVFLLEVNGFYQHFLAEKGNIANFFAL